MATLPWGNLEHQAALRWPVSVLSNSRSLFGYVQTVLALESTQLELAIERDAHNKVLGVCTRVGREANGKEEEVEGGASGQRKRGKKKGNTKKGRKKGKGRAVKGAKGAKGSKGSTGATGATGSTDLELGEPVTVADFVHAWQDAAVLRISRQVGR